MLQRNNIIEPASLREGPLSPSLPELHVDPQGAVVSSNSSARALFPGLVTPGKSFKDLLHEADKFGILNNGAAAGILDALLAGRPQHLFEMRDGRAMLLSNLTNALEWQVLSFTDVSYVMQVTLSRQRDVLTGLANRLELLRQLEERLGSPANDETAVLYLDLDRFKLVNDTLGHPIGDALLKLVSDRLSKILGPKDILARLGGDEFVILQAAGEQPNAAEALASRAIDLVGRTYLIQGHSVQVGVSVGIALAGLDGKTPEHLIRSADLALFKAKSAGRSTFRFFTEAMDQEMQARRSMENRPAASACTGTVLTGISTAVSDRRQPARWL
jgi:diguanylate cyclase (GGDEF)-like protein